MDSRLDPLFVLYSELSSVYKNPTRDLRGMAASDKDAVLLGKHAKLLALFRDVEWGVQVDESALRFKILGLLYEIDDYRGITPSVEWSIRMEPTASVEHFNTHVDLDEPGNRHEEDFSDPNTRALWKAKVLCSVASIESKRKGSDSDALLHELNILEKFVQEKLHRSEDAQPAWTTLAFVRTAQARIARQRADYTYVHDKLLSVVECLDERAVEIIEKLSDRLGRRNKAKLEGEIRELEDDLVFIRQKQTLILFSVGLDNLQRGFLDGANHACQAARFQFRLHGQVYHSMFNELLMISIKRALTPTRNKAYFRVLQTRLEQKILPRLEPKGTAGNPKLYVYGLRELAVIQHLCGKSREMLVTLRKMEKVKPLGPQWKSRISLLHSRALYNRWRLAEGERRHKDSGALLDALNYSEAAFKHATGGKESIGSHIDARELVASIKNSGSRNLIDTRESLVTYGTVQLFLKQHFDEVRKTVKSDRAVSEALKSAEAVIELSKDDNPRLLAMGHLVKADAYRESNFVVEARRHLEIAKTLEARIQHKYVEDRRRAIEEKIPTSLILYSKDCGHLGQAEDTLLAWYIGKCDDKSSVNQIHKQLGISRGKVIRFIERQGPSSLFYHLLRRPPANKKRRPGNQP